MTYNIGIVGYGKIARDQHVPAIRVNPEFNLVGVVDPALKGAVDGIPAFDSVLDLCEIGQVDAVAICTPPQYRCALAREAMKHGVHILLEKPPAATVGEFERLVELNSDPQAIIFVAWHSRYNAAVAKAKRCLFGKAVSKMQVTWREDVRRWHPGQEWIWRAGGFGVFDPGINALSIVTEILPYPLYVSKASLYFPENANAPIAANLTLESGWSGEDLQAEFDWRETGPQTWSIEIETKLGERLALLDGGSRLLIDGFEVATAPSHEYRDIYARFLDCIENSRCHTDAAPLQLTSDAFMIGERITVDRFEP